MTLIDQCYVSTSLNFFKDHFKNKYKLREYYTVKKPCIFYGCYKCSDLQKIKNHRSLKVIIFGGSDTYYENKSFARTVLTELKELSKSGDVKFISQSRFISKDLDHFKIKHKFLPIAPTVCLNSKPVKKGPNIYIYTSPSNERFYGSYFYKKLIHKFKDIKFILTCARKSAQTPHIRSYSKSELHKIYSTCFIGIRLTKHDGISATVQEMGLLGIKTIHNGNSPSCINYTNYDSIIQKINEERKTIGTIDYETAKKTYDFLNINKDWLSIEYYND